MPVVPVHVLKKRYFTVSVREAKLIVTDIHATPELLLLVVGVAKS